MTDTEVLLIRHAHSLRGLPIPEPEWPLSEIGMGQAELLADELAEHDIAYFYSSPFVRAVSTLEPLANRSGSRISVLDALRERKLSGDKVRNWEELVQRSWRNFDFSLPDGESFHACQSRMCDALSFIAERHAGETVAVCSHGNAIALFLNSIDPAFGHDAWKAMKNPDIFRLRRQMSGAAWSMA